MKIKDLPIFTTEELKQEGKILFENISTMEPIINKLIELDLNQFNQEIPTIKKEMVKIDKESRELKKTINTILKLIMNQEGIIEFNNQCLEVSNQFLIMTNNQVNKVNREVKGAKKLILISFIKSSFKYHFYTTKKIKTYYLTRDFIESYNKSNTQAKIDNRSLEGLSKEILNLKQLIDPERIIKLLTELLEKDKLNSSYLGAQNKKLVVSNQKEKEKVDKLTYESLGEILGKEIIGLLNGLFNDLIRETIDQLKNEVKHLASKEQVDNFFNFCKHQLFKDFLTIQKNLIKNLDNHNIDLQVENIKIDISKLKSNRGVK